jgi:hypothetical protein
MEDSESEMRKKLVLGFMLLFVVLALELMFCLIVTI